MNRRSFFGFLAAAPVGAVAAIQGYVAAKPDQNIRSIAHIMKAARQIIDDAPSLVGEYIDGNLRMSLVIIRRLTIRASTEGVQQAHIDLRRLRQTQELLSNYPTT